MSATPPNGHPGEHLGLPTYRPTSGAALADWRQRMEARATEARRHLDMEKAAAESQTATALKKAQRTSAGPGGAGNLRRGGLNESQLMEVRRPEVAARIRELAGQGLGSCQIAVDVGVHAKTVRAVARRLDIPLTRHSGGGGAAPRRIDPATAAAIVDSYRELRHLVQVGKRHGLHYATVRRVLVEHGVRLRSKSHPIEESHPEVAGQIVLLAERGLGPYQIGAELGINAKTVVGYAERAGFALTRHTTGRPR